MCVNTPVYVAGFERGVRPIGDWSMSITLSMCCSPSSAVVRPGGALAPCRRWASARSSVSITSVDLPEPDTPVTQVNTPSGNAHGQVAQVVPARALDRQLAVRRLAALPGHVDALSPRQVRAGQRRRELPSMSSGVPAATMRPPCTPAPGPCRSTWSAARIVSSSCSTTSTRVAEVAQARQRVEQARVVALVQADRRLVEDVEHADQRAADLGRQPDALRLAARQRRRGAIERQVIEPDVDQERQPLADLAQDAARDLLLARRQLQPGEEVVRLADCQRGHLGDALVADA